MTLQNFIEFISLHLEGWILPVHLAIGLAFTVIEKGYRVRFYTLNELAAQLHNARIHNYEVKFIASVKRFHLLVIDELGYVPIKPEARFLLFELFAKLYEQSSLIITTHLRFEEWGIYSVIKQLDF